MGLDTAISLAAIWWMVGTFLLKRACDRNERIADATIRRSIWRWSWTCFIWPISLWRYRREPTENERREAKEVG